MAERTVVTDPTNKPIGQLVDYGDYIEAQNMIGKPLARYVKRTNMTESMIGKPAAKGNILAAYFFN